MVAEPLENSVTVSALKIILQLNRVVLKYIMEWSLFYNQCIWFSNQENGTSILVCYTWWATWNFLLFSASTILYFVYVEVLASKRDTITQGVKQLLDWSCLDSNVAILDSIWS